jgi:hypothetical protein
MAKVRKRTWQTKTGEHTAWVADYFSPGSDGKRQRHSKTFSTKKEATAWLATTVVEIRQGVHTPAHRRSDSRSGNVPRGAAGHLAARRQAFLTLSPSRFSVWRRRDRVCGLAAY